MNSPTATSSSPADLTLPPGDGPHPAVILISGSGGHDRDYYFAGFEVFETLSGHIVGQNVAVLRLDDRGAGGSSGFWQEATLHDRAADVLAALALLQARDDIDTERIGLIGHSAGGLVALIAANQGDRVAHIAHLALLATPAVPGDQLLQARLLQASEVRGAGPEFIELGQAHLELLLQALATGVGWSEVEQSARDFDIIQIETLIEAFPDESRGLGLDAEADIEGAILEEMEYYFSPLFASFVEFDPRPYILALDVPVLALFGVLDSEVPVDQNSTAMSKALDESNIPSYTLASIWPANHFFQQAETGDRIEFHLLKPEFAPEFLEFLLEWLAERAASP